MLAHLTVVVGMLCVAKSGIAVPSLASCRKYLEAQNCYLQFLENVDPQSAKDWANEFVECLHLANTKGLGSKNSATRSSYTALLRKVVTGTGAFPRCLESEAATGDSGDTLLTRTLRTAFERADETCTIEERHNYDRRSGAANKLRKVLVELKLRTSNPSN